MECVKECSMTLYWPISCLKTGLDFHLRLRENQLKSCAFFCFARYFLLKYEDLLTAPITTLVNLYQNLGLDFDISTADALYNHTRALSVTEKIPKQSGKAVNSYYSTYRTSDFDIYKWQKELKTQDIVYVEENCVDLMKKVGYSFFQKPKASKKVKNKSKH